MNKYSAFKRSQIVAALHHAETKLLLWKSSDSRRAQVEKDRALMFTALREKDAEISRAWDNARLFSNGTRKIDT
jgi:hypothetical protein